MDDRLLIPVADLPGPVPDGAPLAYRGVVECLDLSPPPTDAAGYPLRIDGLDVAVGMLARALRMRPESGWTWSVYYGGQGDEGVWANLRTGHEPHGRRWGYRAVPGLIDVEPAPDLDGPLAPRLAIIACLRARVWEGR